MAEWSKAMDLSPITERCVGSNPTGTTFFFFFCLKTLKMKKLDYNYIFINAAKKYGIDTDNSPAISKLDLITETSPNEQLLIEIPDDVVFPIKEICDKREDKITDEE